MAAPFYALSAILQSVADAVVMPALHRGRELANEQAVFRRLARGAALAALSGSALVSAFAYFFMESPAWAVLGILTFIPLFSSQAAVCIGGLNAHERFHSAALAPFAGALPAAAIVVFLPKSPIALAVALSAFELCRWMMLQAASLTVFRNTSSDCNGLASLYRQLLRGAGWQLIGGMLISLNPLIDILWANTLQTGSVSLVEYAAKLWNAVPVLFSGLLVLQYSRWSEHAARGELRMDEAIRLSFRVFGLLLLATPALVLFAVYLIPVIFGFGAMGAETARTLGKLVAAYLAGVAPMMASMFLVRAVSAAGRLHLLAFGALCGLIVNAVGDWLLVGQFGVLGIGIATAASYLCVYLVLLTALCQRES